MAKKRLVELDIMRGIAFLFVVLLHTVGGFSYRDDISVNDFFISKLLYTIAKCGVAVFIFLSAVTLLYRYGEKLDIKDFYIKKAKFLFLPFAIWSIYILISTGTVIDRTVIWRILSGDAQYHLWYMSMIIRIYLYFPLIYALNKFIKKQNRKIIIASFVVLTICYTVIDDLDISDIIINLFFNNPTDLQIRFMDNSPLNYCYYFIIGVYAVNNYDKFKETVINNKHRILLVYASLLGYQYYRAVGGQFIDVFNYINSYLPVETLFLSTSIMIFYILSDYIHRSYDYISKVLEFISRYSFPAYLIHVSILNHLTFEMSVTNELSCSLEFWLVGAVRSILICWALSYLPCAKYVLGCKSRMNMHKIRNVIKNDIVMPGKRLLCHHMKA